MSNQLQITGGAKVRNLEGVLTGTSGVVSSLGINVPSGIPQLDGSGKILVSQLPNSVMEYKGTWDASTNTPTLVDGTGNAGDVYLCNVAGTVNFGSGPITFYVGDQVLYSGTIWQRASGASGTVTSVAVTESGDALTITGSPITTSGTINIGFAGTGSQYIKGDGTLATFPTTIDQAKRLITEVYNSTGATLSKGTVVYINGGQGNLPTITKAQANADNTSAQTYGVVQSDITNNNNGFVVVFGSLTDIDTQAYAVGTQLYLSGTTAGAWTSTKPSAPIHLVYVGIVVRSHPTQGVVEIRIQNGYELEELHDVAISAPVNNQGIFYNSSNDLWENKSIATALGYTPANDALVVHLAGTETITGVKNFDIGLTLRDGYYPTPANGYIGLASNGSGLTILTKPSATVYNHNLQFQASSNDYNFPAITGVMAMLEGTQTFSGNKTFSALTAFTFLNGTRMDYGLYLSKGSVPSAFSGSTVNLYSDSGNNNLVVRDNSNTSLLQFQAASSYTYTFPASSGTLALTSDLSSYVPYTGATTNVDLGSNFLKARTFYSEGSGGGGSYAIKNGTTPSFEDGYTILSSNDYRLNIVSTVSAATKAVYFGFSGVTATRTYTLPDATGTIALTSDLSSYLPLTGGTLTGALNGTSATFSSSVTATEGIFSSGGVDGSLGAVVRISTTNTNGNARNWALVNTYESYGDLNFRISTAQGGNALTAGTTIMTLNRSGNVGIGTTSPAARLDVRVPVESPATGAVALIAGTSNGANDIFRWFDGATQLGVFKNNGNVGIGTSSPTAWNGNQGLLVTQTGTGNTNTIYSLQSAATSVDTGGILEAFSTNTTSGSKALGSIVFLRENTSTTALSSYTGFYTNSGGTVAERMRITSGGDVLIGQTTASGSVNGIYLRSGQDSGMVATNDSVLSLYRLSTNGKILRFFYAGSEVGSISTNTNSLPSDLNFKKDITDMYLGLDLVTKLRPVHYRYKLDEDNEPLSNGIIAQELEEALLECGIEKNSLLMLQHKPNEKEGESQYWVDYTKMIPVLVKAIQELNAKVTALENK